MIGNSIPTVEITIGKKNEKFIIDTGSTSSYISSEFLKQNRCFKVQEEESSYASASENIKIKSSLVKVVIFNNEYELKTISLKALNQALTANSQYPVIGILGSDFLRRNKLVIDYNKRIIYQSKK